MGKHAANTFLESPRQQSYQKRVLINVANVQWVFFIANVHSLFFSDHFNIHSISLPLPIRDVPMFAHKNRNSTQVKAKPILCLTAGSNLGHSALHNLFDEMQFYWNFGQLKKSESKKCSLCFECNEFVTVVLIVGSSFNCQWQILGHYAQRSVTREQNWPLLMSVSVPLRKTCWWHLSVCVSLDFLFMLSCKKSA